MEEKPKILIVDDNSEIVLLLETMIAAMGYGSLAARSGEEGLNIFNEVDIDLILLDIMMPGIDGFEVTREIRKHRDKGYVPVILLTALSATDDRIAGIEAGCDDFISKPFDMRELKAKIKSLLKIKGQNEEVLKNNKLLHKIAGSYIDGTVLNEIIGDPQEHLKLGGSKCCGTILFADIRGFTNFSEKHNPDEIKEVLNELFPKWVNAVMENEGTFDKYLGDGIMAFFSEKEEEGAKTLNALETACTIRDDFQRNGYNKFGIGVGIGINSGEVFMGNVGSDSKMEYTVIGDPVNTAQRLESQANSGQILISEHTYRLIENKVEARKIRDMKFKGKDSAVAVFEVLEITGQKSFK